MSGAVLTASQDASHHYRPSFAPIYFEKLISEAAGEDVIKAAVGPIRPDHPHYELALSFLRDTEAHCIAFASAPRLQADDASVSEQTKFPILVHSQTNASDPAQVA
jgi:hypothetical protein